MLLIGKLSMYLMLLATDASISIELQYRTISSEDATKRHLGEPAATPAGTGFSTHAATTSDFIRVEVYKWPVSPSKTDEFNDISSLSSQRRLVSAT